MRPLHDALAALRDAAEREMAEALAVGRVIQCQGVSEDGQCAYPACGLVVIRFLCARCRRIVLRSPANLRGYLLCGEVWLPDS